MKKSSRGKASLRPRARILRTFGDELISSDLVALIELVKNSYDADATHVSIRFYSDATQGHQILEVIDNGHGMDLNTIQTTWMEPATLFKQQKPYSRRFARRVLGEKGIGRFASSRLANVLEVISREKNSGIETRAFFDWALFDNENKYLDEIEVEWEERLPLEIVEPHFSNVLLHPSQRSHKMKTPHGTILRMRGLRNTWGAEKFQDLSRDLSRLVSPFAEQIGEKGNSFAIRLDLPEPYIEFSGIIEPSEVIAQPHYTLKGKVKKNGDYAFSIKLKGQNRSKKVSGAFLTKKGEKPRVGELDVEFRVWDRDQISLKRLATENDSTLGEVREALDNSAGVSVYRDGFRVLPYGERGNDWLRLDYRRFLNPTLRISNNQIVGFVSISANKNPDLRDQSNREGLIEGQALNDLRELLVSILSLIETERYAIRPRREPRTEAKTGLFANFELKSIQEYVKENFPDDKTLRELLGQQDNTIKEGVSEVQQVLSRYQRLATLGQIIDTVLHDGRAPLSKIKNEAELGKRDLDEEKNEILDLISLLAKRFNRIETNSDVLATLFRRIEPFGGRRKGRPAQIRLEEIISDAFDVFESAIKNASVVVELPKSNTLVSVDQAEIQEVLINLLQNSLYWLNNVSKEKREIRVEIEEHKNGVLKILFSDSGPGVSAKYQDRIFEPYFSTKPNGIGLGLTIAGEIVTEFYDGSLELIKKGPLPGANFRITLKRRV